MELDLWSEDFQLAREWGLEMPVVQTDGQFGDLKSTSRHGGDESLSLQPQGATLKLEPFEEDVLGAEWMESSDLGSFLDALGDNHERLHPFESNLLEFTSLITPDDSTVSKDILSSTLQFPTQPVNIPLYASHGAEDFSAETEFENHLSPPDSPEQVAPVINLEPVELTASHMTVISPDGLLGGMELASESLTFTELDFVNFNDSAVGSIGGAEELLGSPLSVDDVESTISFSGPSSPETSQSSIIESSPELYKVISTSSIDASKRFSPYSRSSKSKQSVKTSDAKAPRKTRTPAQPVPEHVIMEHLDKKDRKKLQNKNAAIRYRMKKKGEAQGIKGEEQELEELNTKLKTKVDDLQREIKYMKNLMEDVCKAKGIQLK
ncbi:ApCREB2 protein [Aplysia californica]|uniref:ApCREB2 n=2 Tax=Aplysia californica TaxID=6500 RepID=Q16946_APLCA|nr:ApCREB2 protein [Aplysia californica]AAA92437.1 ApCREB2 [Aplysia californica]